MTAAPSSLATRRSLLGALAAAAGLAPTGALALRRPGKPPLRDAALTDAAAAIPTSPALVRWLQKASFGYTQAEYTRLLSLGGSDDARWQAWVTEQLNPGAIGDSACDSRLASAAYLTLGKSLTQLWSDHHADTTNYYNRMLPVAESECATLLRATYSKRQLYEVLVDFWHDHFSVMGWDYNGGPVFVHYDRDVIRPNVLGNFRSFLEAVAKSTTMLYFLNNSSNTAGQPNENYARELFELHGLGAENYYGLLHQNQVPADPGNPAIPAGYCDDDVYEAARAFTGWTVKDGHWPYTSDNDGTYIYRSGDHDAGIKNVLGVHMYYNQPNELDGKQVLDAIASHPGCARFIARKLCRRFVVDEPSSTLVDTIANLFQSTWQASDQLRQVTQAILLSTEFKQSWGGKMKRPANAFVSALRGLGADFTPRPDNTTTYTPTEELLGRTQAAGHRLFYWPAPNGYPDRLQAWSSSGSLGMTWRLLSRLPEVHQDDAYNGSKPLLIDVLGQTTAAVGTQATASAVVGYWCDRLLGPGFRPEPTYSTVVAFMQQNAAGAEALDLSKDEWHGGTTPDLKRHYTQQRLRTAVGLLMLSPDFLRR